MGRPKGGKNKSYSKEEKLKIVKLNLEDHISIPKIEKMYGVSRSCVHRWIHSYLESGEDRLDDNGKKRGNPFAALHTSKSLTNEERLTLENAQLRIENERLKKGYMVKGVGANKEFVTTKDLNMKSSKN